jgi:hypothetical protein
MKRFNSVEEYHMITSQKVPNCHPEPFACCHPEPLRRLVILSEAKDLVFRLRINFAKYYTC